MKKNISRKKQNGFTLVELLAVIVILAIILVIAVPKVMSVIEDAKKATLESTAKMIAGTAEKQKVQNQVLGNIKEIRCEDIVKINDVDYELCSIEFEGNIAKVTLIGKGKFEGLNVCNGTKIDAEATEECTSSGNNTNENSAANYIEELLAKESTEYNGLTVDDTSEQNIRYAGPLTGDNAVKNQVYFNCKDEYTSNSKTIKYGDADYVYEGNCEVWRIIGVFNTKSSDSETEEPVPRIKIVRDAFSTNMSWDSSDTTINSGWGVNQWGKVKDSNGNITYEGSDLMRMLNGYYIGEEDTCTYCSSSNQGTCPISNNCASSVGQLSSTSLEMVEDALWYTGAPTFSATLPLSTMYAGERSTQSGKICTPACNDDNVTRTTTWVGKIGLIYPSDYTYASTDYGCTSDILGSDSTCNTNNWLHPSSGSYWTISPRADFRFAFSAWIVSSSDRVYTGTAYNATEVRPALYLSSNVQIIGGDGTDGNAYKLSDGEQ